MNDLNYVCENLLDNADLDVYLDGITATIKLCFTVGGSLEEVIFECSNFHIFKMVKPPDYDQALFVGETKVTTIEEPREIQRWLGSEGWTWENGALQERLYLIETLGEVEILILCEKFSWDIKSKQLEKST
jgi:hypothetical protein